MRKIKILAATLVLGFTLTGCLFNNKNREDRQNEIELVKNVEEGFSHHTLVAGIPADHDHGTGEYDENIINYKSTNENYYVGPKEYVAISDYEFVIYDRVGEQIVWWGLSGERNFYSVDGYNVEGLHYDGKDILLKCTDGNYYPITKDGNVSKSSKSVYIKDIATEELKKMVEEENKYVSVLRVDRDKNFYTHEKLFLPQYDAEYFEHRICKYDKDGKLLGYAIYYPDKFVAEPDEAVVVTENGSIYRMVCVENKVNIYKVILGTTGSSYLVSNVKEHIAEAKTEKKNEYQQYVDDNYSPEAYTHTLVRDVLVRYTEFIDTDNGGKKTIKSNFKLSDGSDYTEGFFSLVDVDKDGYNEIFVRQKNDSFVVFKYIDNQVYSYQIESEIYLSVDGIMYDNGAYFIPKFTTEGYTKKVLAHFEEYDEEEIFYIGQKNVSMNEYDEYTRVSDSDVYAFKWYGATMLDYFAKAEDEYINKYIKDYKPESYVPQEIVDVLLYDKEFINASDNSKRTRMSQFMFYNGEPYDEVLDIESFVVVDIDKDGYSEVVAYMDVYSGDVNVFHYEVGEVYSYNFTYRSAIHINEDGYFYGSSGASSNSTYRLVFDKDKYTREDRCQSNFDIGDVTYYVGGEEVSEERYSEEYDKVWGNGQLQEYKSLIVLLNMTDK